MSQPSYRDICDLIESSGELTGIEGRREYRRTVGSPPYFHDCGYGVAEVHLTYTSHHDSTVLVVRSRDTPTWTAYWKGDRFDNLLPDFNTHGCLSNWTTDNFTEYVQKTGGYATF